MRSGRLEGRGLVLRHGGLAAVDDVDIESVPGQITAVIGPNGAGKTSLFDCLSGVQQPEAGAVLLDGVDITTRSPDERSRLGVVRTFQRSSVFTTLTVEENLLVGAENRRSQGTVRGVLGLPDAGRTRSTRIVDEVMAELGLNAVGQTPAGQLPTGTLRMVELARALCAEPVAVLLDEPASGLDDREVDAFRRVLARVAARGLSLLLIEHDIDLVESMADVVCAMVAGRVVAVGPPEEIMARPDVRTRVLGMTGR